MNLSRNALSLDWAFESALIDKKWIAKYPEALGEELLVIQKEFAGFLIPRNDSIFWLWTKKPV